MAKAHGTPRRTVLLESRRRPGDDGHAAGGRRRPLLGAAVVHRADGPHHLADPIPRRRRPAAGTTRSSARSRPPPAARSGWSPRAGRLIRLSALELPTLPPTNGAPSLSGGAPLAAYVDLPRGEEPLTIVSLAADSPGIALGTAQGVVKRVTTDYPGPRRLRGRRPQGRRRGGGRGRAPDRCRGPRVHHLRRPAAALRRRLGAPAGPGRRRHGRHQAGRRAAGRSSSAPSTPAADAVVVTSSGSSGALPGTEPGSLKVTPYAEYPAKGRATGGVRCHRFLRGEDTLVLAWVGETPARAAGGNGVALDLPEATGRRDGSGVAASTAIARIAAPPRSRTVRRTARPPRDRPRGPGPGCLLGRLRPRRRRARTGPRPTASFFVALEQPGPWGRVRGHRSRTCPRCWAATLDQACSSRGGRLTLIRRPGRHADDPAAQRRGAATRPTSPGRAPNRGCSRSPRRPCRPARRRPRRARARRPRGGRGVVPDSAPADPVLLVCTNGRRDVCCAVRGRPVALDADAWRPAGSGRRPTPAATGSPRPACCSPTAPPWLGSTPTLAPALLESADATSGRPRCTGRGTTGG